MSIMISFFRREIPRPWRADMDTPRGARLGRVSFLWSLYVLYEMTYLPTQGTSNADLMGFLP